jgi:hypothetical protein
MHEWMEWQTYWTKVCESAPEARVHGQTFLNVGINKTEIGKFRKTNSDGTQCASGLRIH